MDKTAQNFDDILAVKDAQIEDLKRQVNNLQMMIFGSQSERPPIVESNPDQPFLDFGGAQLFPVDADGEDTSPGNSSEKASSSKNSSKKKKKGGNQLLLPDDLEVEEMVLDVPEDEKSDPLTGEKFSRIGEEVTDKLVRVKATYKIIRIKRPVYGARENGVIKMDLPQSIVGFSKIDESVWAEVCVRRTCDHLPFYRQVQILARDGINITRQSLNKTHLNIGAALQPLAELLKQDILTHPAINVDETFIKMQMPGKKTLHQAYLWVVGASPPGHK